MSGPSSDPVRVFLLDADEVFRRGMAGVLGDDPHLTVVGEAATATEGLVRMHAVRPDVAVLALPLVDADVETLCHRLRAGLPTLAILVLFGADGREGARLLPGVGVWGQLHKPVRGHALAVAVHAVAAGAVSRTPGALPSVPEHRRRELGGDRLAVLTQRERAVLWLIGEGLTNRQIADRMGLAEKTVKNYTSHLLAKLGLERRTQAAILVTELRAPGSGG